MKTAELFKTMENLVNKHVEAWKTDFEIDKKTIKENPSETTYYWYLRDCGTQLISATDLQYLDTGVPVIAEFWLSRAKAIYKIDIATQSLKPIKAKVMTELISKAKPMSESLKLEYLLKWMSKKEFQTVERPWDILFQNASWFKINDYRINNLVKKSAGIKEILQTLNDILRIKEIKQNINELLSWSKSS